MFLLSNGMKTIYLVEDEEGIRDALHMLLSFENYNVTSFCNVREFNNRDLSTLPDMFILDVMLPDGLGTELCNQIKHNPQTSDIPVIIMSAHAKDQDIIKTCTPDTFIAKPFDIDDVLSKIQHLVN